MMEKIDVVFTVGTGSQWEDNELRFSLRALARHGKGIGRVVIVGHKPSWCTAEHVEAPDPYRYDKDANMIHKVLRYTVERTAEFVYHHDDHLLLEDVWLPDLPYWHKGPLSSRKVLDDLYARRLRNTRRLLEESGYGCDNYDLHAPMRMDPALFRRTFSPRLHWWHQPQGPGITVKSLYANVHGVPGTKVEDCLLWPHKVITRSDAERATAGRPFASLRPKVSGGVRDWLRDRFPEPSRWEVTS